MLTLQVPTWDITQNPKWRPTGMKAARTCPLAVCCLKASTAKRTSPLWIWTTTKESLTLSKSIGNGFTTPQPPVTLDQGRKDAPSSRLESLRRCSAGVISILTSRQWSWTSSSPAKLWITVTAPSASTFDTIQPVRATFPWDLFLPPRLWSSRSTSRTSSTTTITSSSSSRRPWRPKKPSCSTVGWSTKRWRKAPGTHCVPTTPRRAALRSRPRATCPGCAPNPSKWSASSSPSTALTTSWCRRCAQTTTTTVTPPTSLRVDHKTRRRGGKEKKKTEIGYRVLSNFRLYERKWSQDISNLRCWQALLQITYPCHKTDLAPMNKPSLRSLREHLGKHL